MHTWASRFGQMAGKFSPFGRNTNPSNTQVSDSDFSYITNDDLAAHNASTADGGDTVYIKSGKISHPIHFPGGSIDGGEITVGVLRIAAAQKLEIRDARRIRLLYKGRNMKDDKALVREEGVRSGSGAEILCIVGDAASSDSYTNADGETTPFSGSDDEEESGDESPAPTSGASKKKKKRGGGKKKRRGPQSPQPTSTPSANPEYLPMPSHAAPRPSSAPPKPASAAPSRPTSPMGQLEALSDHFEQNLKPKVQEYLQNPPSEKAKRDFERKALSETILGQVLLKLDGVETDGKEEVRARRKALVKEVQGWLTTLDESAR